MENKQIKCRQKQLDKETDVGHIDEITEHNKQKMHQKADG
jgi:hypothetical protein